MNTVKDLYFEFKSSDILRSEIAEICNQSGAHWSCPVSGCGSSDAVSIFTSEDGTELFKCFSCGEAGDIFKLLKEGKQLTFSMAIDYLSSRYGIEAPVKDGKKKKITSVNAKKTKEQFDTPIAEAIASDDLEKAMELMSLQKDAEAITPVLFSKLGGKDGDKPLVVWQNVESVLNANNVACVINEISKEIEIRYTTNGAYVDRRYSGAIVEIESMCKCAGMNINLSTTKTYLEKIGYNNKYNPVLNFLEGCEFIWDEQRGRIQQLADTLITNDSFPQDYKYRLLEAWLISTVRIAHNTLSNPVNMEGALILQGGQGVGKTRWTKALLPKQVKPYFAEGKSLDPKDKDSVKQATKYWIVELGEMDSTFKNEQSKLKQFFTNSYDEYRLPYAIAEDKNPRLTSFIGTVNKEEFLKDDTGSRRWWVIPVIDVNHELMATIDMEQLWGEVMHLYRTNESLHRLTPEEEQMLAIQNSEFTASNSIELELYKAFDWDSPIRELRSNKSIQVICNLKSTSGMAEALNKLGSERVNSSKWSAVEKKSTRGWMMPPSKEDSLFKKFIEEPVAQF